MRCLPTDAVFANEVSLSLGLLENRQNKQYRIRIRNAYFSSQDENQVRHFTHQTHISFFFQQQNF